MKKFDILYKRAKTGKIVSYKIRVEDNGTMSPEIIKETGQWTGKKTVHTESVPVGKQKRTPLEQALNQAESDWKRKHDEGYKTRQDLKIDISGDLMHYSIDHVKYKTLTEALDAALPEFNTDASGNLKPMKAPTAPWKAGNKKNKYPARLEAKLDGCRTLCTITKDEVKFTSSAGKPFDTLTHLEAVLGTARDNGQFDDMDFPLVLDGEIYSHGMTLEEVNEAVKKERPSTYALEFWLFDLPLLEEEQHIRSAKLGVIKTRISHSQIKLPEYTTVNNDEEVKAFHDRMTQAGFEGAMLKQFDGTYQPGQRSSFWQKVKMFDDTEFAFKNFEFGQRVVEDLIAVCWVEVDGEMIEFRAKMNGDLASKERLYKRNDLEGMSLTVTHFGYTKYGIPNLPKGKSFREND